MICLLKIEIKSEREKNDHRKHLLNMVVVITRGIKM